MYSSDVPTPAPKFITKGHLYKAVIGDTIILPCKVKDLGESEANLHLLDLYIVKPLLYIVGSLIILKWHFQKLLNPVFSSLYVSVVCVCVL